MSIALHVESRLASGSCWGESVSDESSESDGAPGDVKSFGRMIRQLRLQARMTQDELAAGMFTGGYISAIERGIAYPPESTRRWLAQRLGVPPATLHVDVDVAMDATNTQQVAKLAYEQVHAQMLVTGDAVEQGREELEAIRRKMGEHAPRELHWYIAYAACRAGDMEVARREADAYQRAVEAGHDSRGDAAAHWLSGLVLAREHNVVRAVAEYQRALEMEDQAYFELDAAMSMRGDLSRLLLALGDLPAAAAIDHEALQQYEEFTDPVARAQRAYRLAEETARTGDWLNAHRFLRWAWMSQREHRARRVAAQTYLRRAVLVAVDEPAPEYELQRALTLSEATADEETRSLALGFLALTLAERGETARARQALDASAAGGGALRGVAGAEESWRSLARGVMLVARGWLAQVEGDVPGARTVAAEADGVLRGAADERRLFAAAAYSALARLYERLDDSNAAFDALRRAYALRK